MAKKNPGKPSKTWPSAVSAGSYMEKRRHRRFTIEDCTITVFRKSILTRIGLRRENVALELLDMSEGGVRIKVGEELPKGSRVRIQLSIPKYSDEIEAIGEVRWCVEYKNKASVFMAGIQFTKIDAGNAKKIVSMKNWFTSPEYKQKRDARNKRRTGGGSGIWETPL